MHPMIPVVLACMVASTAYTSWRSRALKKPGVHVLELPEEQLSTRVLRQLITVSSTVGDEDIARMLATRRTSEDRRARPLTGIGRRRRDIGALASEPDGAISFRYYLSRRGWLLLALPPIGISIVAVQVALVLGFHIVAPPAIALLAMLSVVFPILVVARSGWCRLTIRGRTLELRQLHRSRVVDVSDIVAIGWPKTGLRTGATFLPLVLRQGTVMVSWPHRMNTLRNPELLRFFLLLRQQAPHINVSRLLLHWEGAFGSAALDDDRRSIPIPEEWTL